MEDILTVSMRYSEIRLESERLTARAWAEGDAESAFRIYGDPEVARYLSGTPEQDVNTQRESLRKIARMYERLGNGMGSFPLMEKATGELVGSVLLKPLPRTEDMPAWEAFRDGGEEVPPIHEIEVGWHLRRDRWGRGYATEAARMALDYGFGQLMLEEVWAVLFAENVKSAAVAQRLGMEHRGATDRFYGKAVELYRLAAADWCYPQP